MERFEDEGLVIEAKDGSWDSRLKWCRDTNSLQIGEGTTIFLSTYQYHQIIDNVTVEIATSSHSFHPVKRNLIFARKEDRDVFLKFLDGYPSRERDMTYTSHLAVHFQTHEFNKYCKGKATIPKDKVYKYFREAGGRPPSELGPRGDVDLMEWRSTYNMMMSRQSSTLIDKVFKRFAMTICEDTGFRWMSPENCEQFLQHQNGTTPRGDELVALMKRHQKREVFFCLIFM